LGWLSLPMKYPEKKEDYAQSRLQITHRFSRGAEKEWILFNFSALVSLW